jgi:uncharacterized phage protein (TIGR02218 family)
MQILPTSLANHLAQEVTTLATCWEIIRSDAAVYRFTDHDMDVVVEDEIYAAKSGITPTAISSQMGLSVDNLELDGMISADGLLEEDILTGKFDHASVRIFMVNYESPTDGLLPLKSGRLGEVTLQGAMFVAEIRGLTAELQQHIGEVYTKTCRAKLGDGRCGVNLAAFTVTGTVTSVTSGYAFGDTARTQPGDYFSYGLLTFTSGANAWLSMEIREYSVGAFTLFLPMPHAIAVGDTYTAIAGCDKNFSTCIGRFNNALNFRGEPHVPGTDKILETSATRSS